MHVAVEMEVTEDHPEVQALVEEAMKEAEKMSIEQPDDMCADVLEKWIRKVWPFNCGYFVSHSDMQCSRKWCKFVMPYTLLLLHNSI